MGLLSQGKVLTWPETKQSAELVGQLGIDLFIRPYHDVKTDDDRDVKLKNDALKFGDEVSQADIWKYFS